MNDILKIILFNIFLILLLKYDIKCGLLALILMIIYMITIKSNMNNDIIEGYDLYFRDLFYMPDFNDKNEFGAVMPNSVEYNSDYGEYSTRYSFYKGEGKKDIITINNQTLYNKTDNLLNELIDMIEDKKTKCNGEFEYGDCSKECGKGKQTVTYKIKNSFMNDNCEYKDGYTYTEDCYLRECNEGEKCSEDNDCINEYCEKGICSNIFGCDKDRFLENCRTKKECLGLNDKYKKGQYKYKWDGTICSQKDKEEYTGEYDTELIEEAATSKTASTNTATTTTTTTTDPSLESPPLQPACCGTTTGCVDDLDGLLARTETNCGELITSYTEMAYMHGPTRSQICDNDISTYFEGVQKLIIRDQCPITCNACGGSSDHDGSSDLDGSGSMQWIRSGAEVYGTAELSCDGTAGNPGHSCQDYCPDKTGDTFCDTCCVEGTAGGGSGG